MFIVADKNGNIVGKYKTAVAARRARDRKDNAYGACFHQVWPMDRWVARGH